MENQFTNDKPIYLQLIDYFKMQIISGELTEGSRLDSVRDLAVKAQVNPNTMQKALSELERMGLVRTERTSGRFITDNKEMIKSMKKELAETEIEAFLEKMKALGLEKEEVVKIICEK
ncbi:MAG: GntR family transcriptional regulator [Treponema sp.]|nr:GntR family transcriptional regulator [Treponema sp.]